MDPMIPIERARLAYSTFGRRDLAERVAQAAKPQQNLSQRLTQVPVGLLLMVGYLRARI
jgi:hypothetical protein